MLKFASEYRHFLGKDITSFINFCDYPTMHDHDFWEILILTDGTYTHTINNQIFSVKAGDCYLIRPSDFHGLKQTSEKGSHFNIVIKPEKIEKFLNLISPDLYDFILKKDYVHFELNPIQISSISDYIYFTPSNPTSTDGDLFANLMLSKLLNYVIDQNYNFMTRKPAWIVDLISEIKKPKNLCWRVDDARKYANFSRTHLNRAFNKYFNCSVGDYLTDIKMAASVDYLIHSDLSIGEISSILGYTSVSHFNHLFKKKFNCSPLEYKKR